MIIILVERDIERRLIIVVLLLFLCHRACGFCQFVCAIDNRIGVWIKHVVSYYKPPPFLGRMIWSEISYDGAL